MHPAHAGHPNTESALLLCALHPSLHLDTTPVLSSHVAFPTDPSFAPQLLSLVLEHRLLFGSDAPNVFIARDQLALETRAWIRRSVATCVGRLGIEDVMAEMSRIGEAAELAVFGEAARKLERGVLGVDDAMAALALARIVGKL